MNIRLRGISYNIGDEGETNSVRLTYRDDAQSTANTFDANVTIDADEVDDIDMMTRPDLDAEGRRQLASWFTNN